MEYHYKIVNNEIIEVTIINGKPIESPTGARAFYTKKEIAERYQWGRKIMRENLMELGNKIYDINSKGELVTTKKVFSPKEICAILEYYGLP